MASKVCLTIKAISMLRRSPFALFRLSLVANVDTLNSQFMMALSY